MAPPFIRFQTKELSMWINQRNAVSDEQQDSIQQIQNRFRSGGMGKMMNIFETISTQTDGI